MMGCFSFPFCFNPWTSGTFEITFSTFLESLSSSQPCSRTDLKLCCLLLVKAKHSKFTSCQIFCFVKGRQCRQECKAILVNRLIYWLLVWYQWEILCFKCCTAESSTGLFCVSFFLALYWPWLRLLKHDFVQNRLTVRSDLIIGTQMASTLKHEQCCSLPYPPPPAEKSSVSWALPG